MKILISCDHRGTSLRDKIVDWCISKGHEPVNMGPTDSAPVDYPVYAIPLAERVVASGGGEVGILICGWGNGMAIAANKVIGARAALCMDRVQAEYARRHNDANILVLSAEATGWGMIEEIMTAFLNEKFESGRHQRRIDFISSYERKRK